MEREISQDDPLPKHHCSMTSCKKHAALNGVRMEVSKLVRLLLILTCPNGHKTLQLIFIVSSYCLGMLTPDSKVQPADLLGQPTPARWHWASPSEFYILLGPPHLSHLPSL